MPSGFKFVAPDLTTRNHAFSYLEALRSGDWLEASAPTEHASPCPRRPGDGLCVAHTVAVACSGGQSASNAVGLIVEYENADILAYGHGKTRVGRLKVTGIFDPLHLIRLGLCAELSDADLRRANLSGANLSDVDLSGAHLRGANLSHANLRHAYNIPATAVGDIR